MFSEPLRIKKIDAEDLAFMPVSCLNTFTQDWTIKVKVMKKYEFRHWSNQKGSGDILNLDLMDQQNTQITATFYNESALKWNDVIV